MEAMLTMRVQQIEKFGHTPEIDARKSLTWFARELENAASAVREDVQFGKPLAQIRRHTVKLGAMAMALFDRLDRETD